MVSCGNPDSGGVMVELLIQYAYLCLLTGDQLVLPKQVHHSNLNLIDGHPHAEAVSWSIAKRKPFDWVSLGLFLRGESESKCAVEQKMFDKAVGHVTQTVAIYIHKEQGACNCL